MVNRHLGSNFDHFLDQEGLRVDAEAMAIKRLMDHRMETTMKTRIFPIAKGDKAHWPPVAVCPVCNDKKVYEPPSMAILTLGALLMDRDSDSGGPSPDLDAFFCLHWHGAHERGEGKDREIWCTVDIAEDVHGGQAEFYFCSTSCLRRFLSECVDELERRIEKGSLHK